MKQTILKTIKPTAKERTHFKQCTTSFLQTLNKNLTNATAILGGSGAKDTWLKGNHDADIFVQFSYKHYEDQSSEISDHLEKSLKRSFKLHKITRLHGSRDYFQLTYDDLEFEVVPIIKITKAQDALNITDISPLHAQWVNKEAKKLKDDIRLSKQFCKANRLYGAESYIGGFSGYILEILTTNYGGFDQLLKASQKWKNKEVIDYSKFYKKGMALFNLNKSKQGSPIIIIDPVDKYRNAAAALSKEKLKQFQKLAKEYLKKPTLELFNPKPIELKELQTTKHNLIYFELTPKGGKPDVVGMKLKKAFEHMKKELKKFTIHKADWDWNKKKKAQFYFIVKKDKLPKETVQKGPPLEMKEHVKQFKKKHKQTYKENNHLMAKVKTKHPTLKSYLNNLLKDKYVLERIKEIKKVVV